jgi:hypothetical protein
MLCVDLAALRSAGVDGNQAAVRVVRDHRSVNAIHSAALEGPERFTQAAAAAQVPAGLLLCVQVAL